MSFRRVGRLAIVALATLLWASCGQVYRPVVIPVNPVPPNPANFHEVFGVSTNVPANPGTAVQIDVSGDIFIGAANMGVNPNHAAVLPNNSRVFVASAGSVNQDGTLNLFDADVIMAFTPASVAGGLGPPTTFPLPTAGTGQSSGVVSISEDQAGNVTATLSSPLANAVAGVSVQISGVQVTGYDGSFVISSVNAAQTTIQYSDSTLGLAQSSGGTAMVPLICSYQPDFVATAQNNAVFVANYGVEGGANCNVPNTDSVALLNPASNSVTNIGYLPPGAHPVAMAETPDGQNLYVLNQGLNSISDLSPVDLTPLISSPIPVGSRPEWIAMRPDGRRIYVLTQGDGALGTIDTTTNVQIAGSPQSVGGPGVNFVLYDQSRNRLYVTNPTAGLVFVFDATTDPPTPLPLGTKTGGAITIPAPPACAAQGVTCGPVTPVSVAALIDGSRFYVASYVTVANTSPCPDPNVTANGCVIPQVTVFDAANFSVGGASVVKTTVFPLLPPIATPVNGVQPYALAPSTFCAPVFPAPVTPARARFRMFAAASVDGSRVYASMCDGGVVAIINTTTSTIATGQNNSEDTLVTDLTAPFSATPVTSGVPPPQSPVFLVTGQ